MIRGPGEETSSTYSQTLNRHDIHVALIIFSEIEHGFYEWQTPSGPFLVSRTGDVG